MKKFLSIAFLFVLLSCTGLMAQDKQIKFSVTPSLVLPTGVFSEVLSVGGNVELKGEYPVAENINFTGSLGYGFLSSKLKDGGSTTFIPVMAGVNYQLNQLNIGFGLGYISYNFDESVKSTGGFTIRPQVGFDVSDKIQLNLNYTTTSVEGININYIGISPVFKF